MKLFIWTWWNPSWHGGLAFAIAKDESEARKLIIKEYGEEPDSWGELEVRRIDWRVARCVSGAG